METRNFDLGDILSITTGVLVSPDGMDGVYRILNFMTGESLFTHQLPRAADQCAPALREQHPQLSELQKDADFLSTLPSYAQGQEIENWLNHLYRQMGKVLPVTPLANHVPQNAIEELADMIGPERIYVFDPKNLSADS